MALTTAFNASSIYGAMSKLANRGPEVQNKKDMGGGADFGSMVKETIDSVVDQGNKAEQSQKNLLAGKADLIDVVTAVSETEVALDTMVSVRDRVISAYEEIMRMPI